MEAIGLNPIRLDAIGIDPICLNAIRLGVPGASSGSDRPYIAPEVLASLVAVCICDGKSNNDPDRAIIKNLVDPDNPFVISNAAYKLNSGYGKYEEDFTTWNYDSSLVTSITSDSVTGKSGRRILWIETKNRKDDLPSFKVKIELSKGSVVRYWYVDENGSNGAFIDFTKSGEYQLPISYYSKYTGEDSWDGFAVTKGEATITQIPSFQGSFYADGVNDMITSTKTMSEMLGGGNKCTVISFITHISGAGKYNVIGNKRIQVSDYSGQSFMAGCSSKSGEKIVELGDKEKIQSFQYTTFDSKLSIGSLESGLEISSYAYYGTFVFNKDSVPIDWIHQVIAYFYLDKYVTPGIIYDTIRQGITNENHASFNDELVDFSGNGHNLKIYNSAWKENSGIGLFGPNFTKWAKDAVIGELIVTESSLEFNTNRYAVVYRYPSSNDSDIASFKINIKFTEATNGNDISWYYYDETGTRKNQKLVEGENVLETSYMSKVSSGGWCGIYAVPDSHCIIEQISEYEGAWVTDGVSDFGKVENLPIYKDYTVVADRKIVDGLIDNADGGVATRGTKWNAGAFCFDYKDGVYSFGATNSYVDRVKPNRFISYMSKYIHNGITTPVGDAVDNNPLCIAKLGSSIDRYSKLALWSLLLFPYTLSEFLLERQLKRYKLGTLYPDMVEFRPIVKSNVPYDKIVFHNSSNIELQVGNYYTIGSQITIYIRLSSNPSDEIKEITLNGIPAFFVAVSSDNVYQYRANLNSKSPQKINITIDEYIRYEDIVQPYPCIVPIIDTNGKTYSWGDKIKVGTEIQGGIIGIAQANLLPDLYKVTGYFNFNGVSFAAGIKHVIGKTNVFELTNAPTYLKANEPNCIADPQRLRIPNSSYKILGYIPDISGHGNHLKINNSAYAGMSGANGYTVDWSGWTKNNEVIITDSKITFPKGFNKVVWFCYTYSDVPAYKINVQGLPDSAHITYGGIKIHNGINELIGREGTTNAFGFIINQAADLSNLVIEQIGEYEGSFCLDGVEDYLTIPTLSHGAKQILMKVNWQEINRISYDQRGSGNAYVFAIYTSDEGDVIAYNTRNNGKTYIDGVLNSTVMASQLKNITHNIAITNDNVTDANSISPRIGCSNATTFYSKMALFAFMSFDDISSEDEIKELNDIVGIEGGYVESPDYYWDAYGKSNMAALDIDYQDLFQSGNANKMLIDKSKAGLAALELYHNSGNNSELINRRLNLNNFALNEESGYGGWLGVGNLSSSFDNNKVINRHSKGGTLLKGKNSESLIGCGYASSKYYDPTNYISKFKIKIEGLTEDDTLYISQYNVNDASSQQLFNGINEVILDFSVVTNYQYITFRYPPLTNDVDFEFLYEYQNGLVSDGVDDNLKNADMPVLTDYTWIMKRKRLNDKGSTTLCHKGNGSNSNAFLFEIIEGTTKTRSFGTDSTVVFPDLISWQTKNSYNGQTIASGTSVDGNVLHIFMGSNVYPYYTKAVFYKAMLYSKTIDMLSINMLKNLFEKDGLIDVNNPIFKKEEL